MGGQLATKGKEMVSVEPHSTKHLLETIFEVFEEDQE